ncbi:MAG: TonB-dependent receptor, partial [bacterium]
IIVFCLLLGGTSHAATLEGYVLDRDNGQPLIGAQVEILNLEQIVLSDANGFFQFTGILGGIYDLEARAEGYKPDQMKRLRVAAGQTLALEFRLKTTEPPPEPAERERQDRVFKLGKLQGKITNLDNGEPVPGAVVKINELAMGATSNEGGTYSVFGIKPGRYTVEAIIIGFKQVKNYAVEIYPGETTTLDFELEETILPLGTEVVVYGEKPLMDPTKPAAIRSIEPRELERGPVRDLTDILKELPGVVEIDEELHIRGGRTYETRFLVDGVPIEDPLIRKGFGHSLNANTVRELNLYSGGADAEFSGATSGVVEIITREGREDYAGSIVYKNDHPFGNSGFNSDLLELTFSGPEPLTSKLVKSAGLPGETYFFWSGNFLLTDTYLPYSRNLYSSTLSGTSLAPRADNHYSTLFKLSWKLTPLVKLAFSYSAAATINQDRSILETRLRTIDFSYGYPYEYEGILDNYNTFTQKSNQETLSLDYRLSLEKRITLTAARFFTTLHSDVQGKHWTEYDEPLDEEPDIFEISEDSSYYTIERGDGFWDSGDGDSWYDHYIENYTLKGTYETQAEQNYNVKAGLETELQTIQVLDIFKPWLGESGFGLNYDAYKASPATFGAFVQNNLNLQGMVFDFGVRYDLWFPGLYAENALANDSLSPISETLRNQFQNETTEIFGRRARTILSPRFGISNLLTRNLTLFGSYSRFARKPPPQYLYAKLYAPSQATYQLFGNPALDFEKVTNIEVGMKYLPNEKTAIGISGYIKYIQDYIAATVVAPDPRFPDETYFLYLNLDYATSQGVEIEYIHKASDVVQLSANAAFSKAKGERSLPGDILRGLKTRSEGEIYNEISFDWDKPWQFVAKLNINAPEDRDLEFVGLELPRDWNLALKFWGQAGKRYTPYVEGTDDFGFLVYEQAGETNSEIGPWWNGFDFSFQKYYHLGKYTLTFDLEGTNVLDHKNATLINPLTGVEYREGDTIPTGGNLFELPPLGYQLPLWKNPTRFLEPRQLKLGVGVSF